jgi:hypothetical protein
MSEPRVVILVPRRDGFVDRDMLWVWTRAWWQRNLPEFEIFEGRHDEGQFNRSAAINRAAGLADWQHSKPWDVAIIIDSDVVCDPERVREGVRIAIKNGRMVMPFDHRYDLNEQGSAKIRSGWQGKWNPFIRKTYANMVSSVNILTRKLWNETGGFDEGFCGWGFEDNAFDVQTSTFAGGPAIKMPGEVWHFHHATAKEGKSGTETHLRNKRRADLYLLARGDKAKVQALRNSSPPSFEHRPTGIPRILHRTVPAVINPQHESFWERWGKLHPTWELMTHRDPLNTAEWPETSHQWAECTSGAQRAGLIRLEALWRHGGVYVDSDVEPLRSLETLLPLSAFAAWEDERVVPDAVIGAVPGHPAIRKCIDLALTRIGKGAWESGPGVTTEVFRNHEHVLLLPPGTFYPIHYRAEDRDRSMADVSKEPHPWSFGLHWYEHSWRGT